MTLVKRLNRSIKCIMTELGRTFLSDPHMRSSAAIPGLPDQVTFPTSQSRSVINHQIEISFSAVDSEEEVSISFGFGILFLFPDRNPSCYCTDLDALLRQHFVNPHPSGPKPNRNRKLSIRRDCPT